MDSRARVKRYLAYACLLVLAGATAVLVLYLMGTPGWDAPLNVPKIGNFKGK